MHLLLALCLLAADAPRPNVVLVLADDLGYGDLGCYGCPDIKTPRLDALARQGMRMVNFYAGGPECSPTRTALMTGRYPQRVGGLECAIGLAGVGRYDDAIRLAGQHELGLPPRESVLARGLKDAGYVTAICGKWHLGYEAKFLPRKHGFDYSFGPLGGGIDYFRHNEPGGEHMLYQNDEPVRRDGYMTDLIAAEACDFLRRTQDKPFFLYVPFNAPHSPFQGPDDKDLAATGAENFNRGSRATYVKMVQRLDDRLGTILETLDELRLAENTLVIFTSDNGGPANSRNDPFSGRKSTTYEGGIRVPCILRWPGKVPIGESGQVAITMDLTASILALAGVVGTGAPVERVGVPSSAKAAKSPSDGTRSVPATLDGIDIVEHLQQRRSDTPRTLFWRQRRGELTWRGVRDGNLKLVSKQEGAAREDWMFNLHSDSGEQRDLLKTQPADAKRLQELLSRWEADIQPTR